MSQPFQNDTDRLGYAEAGPLLDALHDPSEAVRTAALRALVRLPLEQELWLEIGHYVSNALNALIAGEPATALPVPAQEAIEAAVYVPVLAVREQVREVAQDENENEARTAAYALARARDTAALERLVADLANPDETLREQAAEHLSLLDVSAVQRRVAEHCGQDPEGNVRFWLALALARQGETGCLTNLLQQLSAETIDVPMLWGDPQVLTNRVADRGPFPDAVNALLRRIAVDDDYSDGVRQMAQDLYNVSGQIAHTDFVEPKGPGSGEELTAGEEALPARRAQAAELAERYRAAFATQYEAVLSWEDLDTLGYLAPEPATALVTELYSQLVHQIPPEGRFSAGNQIIYLIDRLQEPFTPDVPALFESYRALDETDQTVRWQLAWIVSRAGLRGLLAGLTPRLLASDATERAAAAQLIEEATRYVDQPLGPVFGGGAAPKDIAPTLEIFIAEASVDPGWEMTGPPSTIEMPPPPDETIEPAPDEAAPSAPQERVVNTGFATPEEAKAPLGPGMPLAAGQPYFFWLEVGEPVAGSIEEAPTPLPLEHLPPEARWLKVALFPFTDEIELTPGEDVGELELLPGGAVRVESQPMATPPTLPDPGLLERRLFFPVKVPAREGSVRLRCNIYYQQILIQSRVIHAQVMQDPQALAEEPALRSVLDYTLSHTLQPRHLQALAPHRLSLMLNENGDGTHDFRFFGMQEFKSNATFDGQELQDLIDQARGALRRAAWGDEAPWQANKPYRYDGPCDAGRLKLDLVRLAVRGYRLYDALINRLSGGFDEAERLTELMRQSGLVQITLKKSARFVVPAALIYDYPFDPDMFPGDLNRYTLCPEFTAALEGPDPLEEGACFQGDCPSREEITHVCPSGFWGYRHGLGLPVSVAGAPDVPSRILYDAGVQFDIGVSTDPDFQLRAAHEQALQALPPGLAWNYADSRNETVQLLKETQPHLVYFYCHGGVANNVPYLHVGPPSDPGLTRTFLRTYKIRWEETRPLVFINGCHTTALEPEIAMDFVSAFVENAAAAGVIGTEITIFEPLATAFAEECFRRFLAGAPISEAVRGARLALLKDCNPLGLVYIPFVMANLALVKR